jgi:hypothetical protein
MFTPIFNLKGRAHTQASISNSAMPETLTLWRLETVAQTLTSTAPSILDVPKILRIRCHVH